MLFLFFFGHTGDWTQGCSTSKLCPRSLFVRNLLACWGWPQICHPPSSASPVPGITGLCPHAPLNSHFNDKCRGDGKGFVTNSKRRATCSQFSYKLCFSSISKYFKVLFLIESFWLYYLKVALLLSPAHLPHSQKCLWEAVRVEKVWTSMFPHLPHTACGLGQIPRHLWALVSSFETWEQDQVYSMSQD